MAAINSVLAINTKLTACAAINPPPLPPVIQNHLTTFLSPRLPSRLPILLAMSPCVL